MPFTLSHAAAVVPIPLLLGTRVVPMALVVGSFAPDLPYFLPVIDGRSASHSLLGLFTLCLPIGLIGYFGFRLLYAPLLYTISPRAIADRLPWHWQQPQLRREVTLHRFIRVVASVLLGAITHIVWDAFTHSHGFGTRLLPWLQQEVGTLGGYSLYSYGVLQHGSTIVGFLILGLWFIYWLRATAATVPLRPSRKYLKTMLWLCILIPTCWFSFTHGWETQANAAGYVSKAQRFLGSAAVSGGSALLASCTVLGLLLQIKRLNVR